MTTTRRRRAGEKEEHAWGEHLPGLCWRTPRCGRRPAHVARSSWLLSGQVCTILRGCRPRRAVTPCGLGWNLDLRLAFAMPRACLLEFASGPATRMPWESKTAWRSPFSPTRAPPRLWATGALVTPAARQWCALARSSLETHVWSPFDVAYHCSLGRGYHMYSEIYARAEVCH